jgi:hypothetical protein
MIVRYGIMIEKEILDKMRDYKKQTGIAISRQIEDGIKLYLENKVK